MKDQKKEVNEHLKQMLIIEHHLPGVVNEIG